MPVIQVNHGHALPERLWKIAHDLPDEAPLLVMVHGYRYSPSCPSHDPHRHILSLQPDPTLPRALSWPRALGFGAAAPAEGLALAYGWEARGSLGRAYGRAGLAGEALAGIVSRLAESSGRPIALIGHSLGARVALTALRRADPGSVGRMILLAGAEFRDEAAAAIDSAAGSGAEVINVGSRENDIFDFFLELWLARGRRQALGFGLDRPAPNWVDLQIDDAETLIALEDLGFPTERRQMRLSHWTPYLRRGLFDFYRTALRQPWALPMGMLKSRLPGRLEPRWSRLLASPSLPSISRA
jgi:pimeloyl-ACP methyl ester carboxylesterase